MLDYESLCGKLLFLGPGFFVVIRITELQKRYDTWVIEYLDKEGYHNEQCSHRAIQNLFTKIVS